MYGTSNSWLNVWPTVCQTVVIWLNVWPTLCQTGVIWLNVWPTVCQTGVIHLASFLRCHTFSQNVRHLFEVVQTFSQTYFGCESSRPDRLRLSHLRGCVCRTRRPIFGCRGCPPQAAMLKSLRTPTYPLRRGSAGSSDERS